MVKILSKKDKNWLTSLAPYSQLTFIKKSDSTYVQTYLKRYLRWYIHFYPALILIRRQKIKVRLICIGISTGLKDFKFHRYLESVYTKYYLANKRVGKRLRVQTISTHKCLPIDTKKMLGQALANLGGISSVISVTSELPNILSEYWDHFYCLLPFMIIVYVTRRHTNNSATCI